MVKSQICNVVNLTKECVARYWKKDCDYVIGFFDRNVSMIGYMQLLYGKENAANNLRSSLHHMTSCHLLHQEFVAVQNDGSSCCVMGRYVIAADNLMENVSQGERRCTFVWELESGEPVIKHVHLSNFIPDTENAPYELETTKSVDKIVVHDEDGVTHFILAAEILYVEACDKRIYINCTRSTITAKMSISEFRKIMGDDFVMVHRSFVVNINHVCEIKKYCVVMSNHTNIPVPVKKYKQVKEEIMRFYDADSLEYI